MKPPPVAYERPATEDECLELLREHGEDARLLAGGQSLVPLLNFRLSRPAVLIDITRIPSLIGIRVHDGRLLLGAAVRQSMLERSPAIAATRPLFRDALAHVGHPQTRSRGTIGGSVAHADPAAELPVVLAALDARLHLRSAGGDRTLAWHEVFRSEFVTACAGDEMLTAVEVPAPRRRTGTSFREYAARYGDFAVAGVAAVIELDDRGLCTRAALSLLAAGPAPVRAREAEQALIGQEPTRAVGAEAAELAVAAAEFRAGHTDVPADYRRHVLRALVQEAIVAAGGRA